MRRALLAVALLSCGAWGCGEEKAADPVVEPEVECPETESLCDGRDEDCDGVVDEGLTNTCGGCATLDPAPLSACGQCGGGTIICATPDETLCVDEIPLNSCGGCEVLPRRPGEACGTCDTGTYACDGQDDVVCEGSAGEEVLNACRGCLAFEETLGGACGTCDSGVVVCNGTEATRCQGDLGDEAFNVCGQCGPVPDEGCDVCGDGVQGEAEECDDGNQEEMDGCSPACELEAAWVRLDPDTFLMGSPDGELGRRSSETLHQVTITHTFLIRATEVTRQEWVTVMGLGDPSLFGACGDQCPVARVSWWDSVAFANRLSEIAGLEPCYTMTDCTGEPGGGCLPHEVSCSGDFECEGVGFVGVSCGGYRLPTEAEWEYSARAGTQTAFASGSIVHTSRSPLDPNLNTVGWYAGNSTVRYEGGQDCTEWFEGATNCGPHPVAEKLPNAFGVFDMHGSVWEWVHDYGGNYTDEPAFDPTGPEEGDARTRRGGSWSSPAQFCRSAFRFSNDPSFRSNGLGFRIVRTVPQ